MVIGAPDADNLRYSGQHNQDVEYLMRIEPNIEFPWSQRLWDAGLNISKTSQAQDM